MRTITVLGTLALLISLSAAHGMSGKPPEDIKCEPGHIFQDGYRVTRCWTGETAEAPPGYPPNPLPLVLLGDFNAPPTEPTWKLVYTREPRHQERIEVKPETDMRKSIDDAANWQTVPDLLKVWQQTESEVVLDDLQGNIKVIHSCLNAPEICAAQEARVSPDGKRVAYSVALGSKKQPINASYGPPTPLWDFTTEEAQIWIYELETGEKYPVSSGHRDRGPVWASNDVLVFWSERGGHYTPLDAKGRNFYTSSAAHLYRARVKNRQLTEVTNLTPGEHYAMTPTVLSNGEIAYSAFHGVAPREKIGALESSAFLFWWISATDINGNGTRALGGAHSSTTIKMWEHVSDWMDPRNRSEQTTIFRGLRSVAELRPGQLAVTNYYAGRSDSGGSLLGWSLAPWEGCLRASDIPEAPSRDTRPGSGHYTACDINSLTPWALDQDSQPKRHLDGRVTGRAGFAAPTVSEGFIYTHYRGWNYRPNWPGMATVESMGGEPTAKRQINRALVDVITNPFDTDQTVCIAGCGLEWHAWDAREITTYQKLHGIPTPEIAEIQPPATECFLNVVNARLTDGMPTIPGKADEASRIALMGNFNFDYPAIVEYFGIEPFDHWPTKPTRIGLYKQHPPIKEPLQKDGSVRLQVPCNQPFTHHGYDAEGDQAANGIAPLWANGELFCTGCHAGHGRENYMIFRDPREAFKNTDAYKAMAGGE